ncbi:hypothetical protein BKA67DRAFT_173296 [Truncatella angustata]|uniref:BTB domain-containing protein n=1 Tax=Truncatella angustata TaxID=152316 RepID=A0A9P9A050_9PEZI|nr:uncharacterized protein BKA67DRAFT_173296 [Truncatella angustata]KAH6656898.1 hypothetical protein BKA67DRAFT_173296 [Truncatella angustata]
MLSLDNVPQTVYESNSRQLSECVQRLRAVPIDKNYIDTACKEYNRTRVQAGQLCKALLRQTLHDQKSSGSSSLADLDKGAASNIQPGSSRLGSVPRASFSSISPSDGYPPPNIYEQHLDMIQGWIGCLEILSAALRIPLLDTYKSWEPDASPAMIEQLFQNTTFRRNVILRLRNASKSARWDNFKTFETRFHCFDQLKADLIEVKCLLHDGESGISPERDIEEISVSHRGDAILEFANKESEVFPVLRFRVSSHMLAEASPIFAHMFGNSAMLTSSEGDEQNNLPPPPSTYTFQDGAEVQVYRMPQLELNTGKSLEILLHAAHMHNDKVPKEIDFDTFVAIAEVCMRYKCTAPLELTVEYLWLPQWLHKANEDMPNGLLLISYAFGMRTLFTRMSKTAILNIVDQEDLESRTWPRRLKDKVWAVRNAKFGQVHHCCQSMLQEYLRCPPAMPLTKGNIHVNGLAPTVKPRCVRGSHSCDAACLGWLMMLFSELQVLPQIMYTTVLSRRPPPPRRSLDQLLGSLRFMASPPQTHTGPCDFAPAFRAAINDIYNSLSGLTLFDVSGKHGWALSRHKSMTPQPVLKVGVPTPDSSVAKRTTDDVILRVMRHLDDLNDVYNAALVNKAFFQSFKNNELLLLRNLIGKAKAPERWAIHGAGSKKEARLEMNPPSAKEDLETCGEPLGLADIEKGLESINIASDGSNRTPEPRSVFEEDSDLEHYQNDFESDSLVEVIEAGYGSPGEKMTREEAVRILWPDDNEFQSRTPDNGIDLRYQSNEGLPVQGSRQITEKFRAGDLSFQSIEEKTLITKEDKNLSDEHYERIGLRRANADGESDTLSEWI